MKMRAVPLGFLILGCILGTFAGVYIGQRGVRTVHDEVDARAGQPPSGEASAPGRSGVATVASARKESPAARRPEWQAFLDKMLSAFDPAEAEAWISSHPLTSETIIAMLSYVSSKPNDRLHKTDLKLLLYSAWVKLEPRAAWHAALVDGGDSDAGLFASGVAAAIAETQPDLALDLALALGMGGVRASVIQSIFERWGRVDIAGAVAYWNRHPELPAGDDVIAKALARAAESNPAFAASQAQLLRGANSRGPALAQVLVEWGEHDIDAALRWAEGMENATERASHVAILVDLWARSDPVAALAYAEKLPNPKGRAIATRNAWNNWLQKDPNAAMDYLASHASADLLDEARFNFKSSTSSLTLQEQQALLDRIPDAGIRQRISLRLVDGQVEEGRYPQAVDLLNILPDSPERDFALRHLGEWWARDNADAAAAWLKSLPDSSDRDLAIEGFARTLAESDPQGALKWIDLVGDAGVKQGGLKNIAVQWLMLQPDRAEAWMNSQAWLTDETKTELRRAASTPGSGSRMTYGANVTNRR